jgi:aquaporin Z
MSLIPAIFAEYVGTFVFLLVILVAGKPIPIALSLLTVILIFGSVSGGHMNPAVSTMMFMKGDINSITFAVYVVAQVLGGLTALSVWKSMKKGKFNI